MTDKMNKKGFHQMFKYVVDNKSCDAGQEATWAPELLVYQLLLEAVPSQEKTIPYLQ